MDSIVPGSIYPMWVSIPFDGYSNIKAAFTTRHGGVSSPPFDSLNLSFQRADSRENVMENFRRLSENLNIPMESMVLTRQVHGEVITVVNKSHCGMGLTRENEFGDTDGLVTAEPGIALVTFHADCAPVYLHDPVKHVIGLVHSGWRSTLLNISVKAVKRMEAEFGCRPKDIIAVVGPHIRQCCFEVDMDVYRLFAKVFPGMEDKMKPSGVKWKIDLGGIIRQSLILAGLSGCNIHDVNHCTVCEKELFFSHRGGKGSSGTGAALLMMLD